MKTIIKIILVTIVFFINGCFNMYNDANEDMGAEYKFYLAIVNSNTYNSIGIASIESTTLSKSSQTTTSSQVDYVAAHPTGNYLYVTNPGSQRILMYRTLSNGTLEVLGSGFINTTDNGAPGGTPTIIKMHPSGNYVFVYNVGAIMNISRYQIDNTGILTYQDYISPLNSATLSRMVIDKSGTYLYWVSNNGGGSDYLHQVEITGSLNIHSSETWVANTPADVVVHPNCRYIYVTVDGFIYLYYSENISNPQGSIAGDGILAIHPNGNFLYTDDGSNVKAYRINADGTLTDLNNLTPVASDVKDFVVDPNGKYLIVSGRGSGSVEYIRINDDGTTSPLQYYDGGPGHFPNALDGYRSAACGLAIYRQKIK